MGFECKVQGTTTSHAGLEWVNKHAVADASEVGLHRIGVVVGRSHSERKE